MGAVPLGSIVARSSSVSSKPGGQLLDRIAETTLVAVSG
jgi:hypothetical protein